MARAVLSTPFSVAVDPVTEPGPDPTGDLTSMFEGLVVASDRVLQAEVVLAAAILCRAVVAATSGIGSQAEVHAAAAGFRASDRSFEQLGHVDVLRSDDAGDNEVAEDDDRLLRRLVRSGSGEILPVVGDQWEDRLGGTATTVFCDDSSHGWIRYLWSRLESCGLATVETELDLARARLQLVAFGALRRGLLSRLDGDDVPDWREWIENPGIEPIYLGLLAGAAGVEPAAAASPEHPGDVEFRTLVDLVRVESSNVAQLLRTQLGDRDIFALTWASRFPRTRYPISPDVVDEMMRYFVTPAQRRAYEWIDGGMTLL